MGCRRVYNEVIKRMCSQCIAYKMYWDLNSCPQTSAINVIMGPALQDNLTFLFCFCFILIIIFWDKQCIWKEGAIAGRMKARRKSGKFLEILNPWIKFPSELKKIRAANLDVVQKLKSPRNPRRRKKKTLYFVSHFTAAIVWEKETRKKAVSRLTGFSCCCFVLFLFVLSYFILVSLFKRMLTL